MAAALQLFLCLFKFKFRRKSHVLLSYIMSSTILVTTVLSTQNDCAFMSCSGNGVCINGTCNCKDGWQGPSCQFCGGKVSLSGPSGTIHDGFGNYSTDVKCSWLVEAGSNATIRLRLEEFATECGWDQLYIFDGDSVSSPLLAVFSGLMYKDDYAIRQIPEVVAHSGSALVHFYSDVNYNMTGFNISYRINSCPSSFSHLNCSGHGICIDGVCTCDGMYDGEACEKAICPNNCTYPNGLCNREAHECICSSPYAGDDCSQLVTKGSWERINYRDSFTPAGSASHGALVLWDSLYIIGGESFRRGKLTYIYDFTGNVWETLHMESQVVPSNRYGHTVALFGDKIYMYGGVEEGTGHISNELWALDISIRKWENITVRAEQCHVNVSHFCGPLRVAGHTATVVTSRMKRSDRMIVIFGHSPIYGYLNAVQEFYFGTREWHMVKTFGHPVKGGYGHSAALDPYTEKIYVYGGLKSDRHFNHFLSNSLYSYDPIKHWWTLLLPGPSARFLHTASFLTPGLMLIFGGNTHNDTVLMHGAKCYSGDMLAYDVICDTWQVMQMPKNFNVDLSRFGHSAVIFRDSLYIYGGFDGMMRNDMLKYRFGNCDSTSMYTCLASKYGVKCVWDKNANQCVSLNDVRKAEIEENNSFSDQFPFLLCNDKTHGSGVLECSEQMNCQSCLTTSFQCAYCMGANQEAHCYKDGCKNPYNVTENPERCPASEDPYCINLHSCQACSTNPSCVWAYDKGCRSPGNVTFGEPHVNEPLSCSSPCSELTSCFNCTNEECIWCQNTGRCIDKNAYTASFPYGQCREWTTSQSRCRSAKKGKPDCEFYKTCSDCQTDPECGWCDDGSNTGLGICMRGGSHVPENITASQMFSLEDNKCPSERWYFTTCPPCQCNGHSLCTHSPKCDACGNSTTGEHCERCRDGYFGSPVNGGSCQPCECSNHGVSCNPETGRCFCTTKGIVGDRCEKCDTQNHYLGDPLNGSCFYDLKIDYQFTFNLSKKDDRHYNQINFKNSPTKNDIDAEFSITCSASAKMNISVKTAGSPESFIVTGRNCSSFRSRFTKGDHNFGTIDNITQTTFYVYVYDFKPPLWIVISFSQNSKVSVQQFFITFSSCFLSLLIIAAILWKIKQRYDLFRRRRRLFVELEQMASRPSSQVFVEIEDLKQTDSNEESHPTGNNGRKKRFRSIPSPIALEPCAGNRAAVLTLLVRLPNGCAHYTPSGQSGFAIASALVTLGNPRTVSLDPPMKSDLKKSKTVSSQHPESCV